MRISNEIEVATITLEETTILEFKVTNWPRRWFRSYRLISKLCPSKSSRDHWWMPVFIVGEFSFFIDNHLYHFQNESVFQIPITLRGKTIFWYTRDDFVERSTIWWFDEKGRRNRRPRVYPYRGWCVTFVPTKKRYAFSLTTVSRWDINQGSTSFKCYVVWVIFVIFLCR